jgi:hypothetical protein
MTKLFILIGILMLLIAGCSTSTGPTKTVVQPPSNVQVTVDAIYDGNSFAIVFWDASKSESNHNFNGYQVNTYQLASNDSNKIVLKFNGSFLTGQTHNCYLSSIQRDVIYKSYVAAVFSDGSKSDSVPTNVFAGIYYNNDGVIDQDANGDTTFKSGYGWDINSGAGHRYSFVRKNAANIDIYCMDENGLKFYSPNMYLTGGKITFFGVVGTGSQAFDQTNLSEPQDSSISISVDNVYLIKTEEGNYIKLWVSRFDNIADISEVVFDYKVQPVSGLRIVKK